MQPRRRHVRPSKKVAGELCEGGVGAVTVGRQPELFVGGAPIGAPVTGARGLRGEGRAAGRDAWEGAP